MQKALSKVHALAVATMVVFASFTPAAHAETPASCRVTTYFADAGKTTRVGVASTCRGTIGQAGRKTKYSLTQVIEYADRQENPLSDVGSGLPCEHPNECANEQPTPVPGASRLIAKH